MMWSALLPSWLSRLGGSNAHTGARRFPLALMRGAGEGVRLGARADMGLQMEGRL